MCFASYEQIINKTQQKVPDQLQDINYLVYVY